MLRSFVDCAIFLYLLKKKNNPKVRLPQQKIELNLKWFLENENLSLAKSLIEKLCAIVRFGTWYSNIKSALLIEFTLSDIGGREGVIHSFLKILVLNTPYTFIGSELSIFSRLLSTSRNRPLIVPPKKSVPLTRLFIFAESNQQNLSELNVPKYFSPILNKLPLYVL